ERSMRSLRVPSKRQERPERYPFADIRVGELCHSLLISHLKLSQKDILCEGIGIGNRRTWPTPLMVAKLVVHRDLTLNLGWKIFEVVVESHDGARIHIIAQRCTGIKLFIHHNR